MVSEISKSENDKYHMISLICAIHEQTEPTSKIETELQSRLTALGRIEVQRDRAKRKKNKKETKNSWAWTTVR